MLVAWLFDSSPMNPDREDLSSSSTVSSSSVENSSSSIDSTIPEGAKRATLMIYQKNINLGTLLGADAYLRRWVKKGYSLYGFL